MKFGHMGPRRVVNAGPYRKWDKELKKTIPTGRIKLIIVLPPDLVDLLEIKPSDMLSIGQTINLGYLKPKQTGAGLKKYNEERRLRRLLKERTNA